MKYAFDKPTLPSLWLVYAGTHFIQIEVVALKEADILLSKKPRCPLSIKLEMITCEPTFHMCPSEFLW
jgi:hypothetical protein